MKLFDRYIFRQTAGALLLILLSLSGIVWIALALRQLNLVTAEGQSSLTLLLMTTLALPNLMALIAPVALLVATIHVLNRLGGDSELIVLTASGATTWTIVRPLLLLGLLVAIGLSIVNHVVMPWSLRSLRDMIVEVRADIMTQAVQPGRFSSPEQGLTFHIRERALDGRLHGLLVKDTRDAEQTLTYLAEVGQIVKQDGAAYLTMINGHIIRREAKDEQAQVVAFQSYSIDLNRFESGADNVELKPRERYFSELAFPARDDPDFKRQPGHFRAELHERFANPLYPIAFVLIAAAMLAGPKSTRQGRGQAIAAAIALALACRLTGMAVNNLVVIRASAVPLLYLIPIAAIALAAWRLSSLNRRLARGGRATPRLSERLSDHASGFASRLRRGEAPGQRAGAPGLGAS